MQYRKYSLETGEVYHVMTKSIAGYEVFGNMKDRTRMLLTIKYYQEKEPGVRFSYFIQEKNDSGNQGIDLQTKDRIVDVIAYCLMPTHLHLILKQLKENGISIFMSKVLNSYTRYLNTKRGRKGPLWEGRFKNVLVEDDEQLLHLTRYIHLNPVTALLVEAPEDWEASSYREYVGLSAPEQNLCAYGDLLEIEPTEYREFVMSRKDYQRELACLKRVVLE
jgi:putative transposase